MENAKTDKGRRDFFKKSIAGLVVLPAVMKSSLASDEPKATTTKLIYRTLGKTGLKLPIVSMGVMNADNPNLVKAALDAGIVHLDTAHVYQRGRNEEMVGQVIKDRPRDSYVLATKVVADHQDRKTGFFTDKTKPEPFIEKFELSLKRLGVEYVDILYLHSVVTKEAVLFEPVLSAMQKLKKSGKIRFIGVSTHRNEPEVIRAATDSGAHDVVLTAYNFKQPHVKEMNAAIEYAAKAGIGIIAMKTQAGVYWDQERQHQINMKAALKWALANKNVHTAIPGFTTFDQMNLDLSVMEDLTLSPEEKEDLSLGNEMGMNGLYCQQCGECESQCHKSLDIPTIMRSYMYAYGYKNYMTARETLLSAKNNNNFCQDCETCPVTCSQGFNVKDRITDIARIKNIPSDFLA
jgi:aryl-alcohol dehydrogenase-like predicted oxidoreductase